jgi:homoserine kinase type II
MATYTDITAESLARFLYMFDLSELASFAPISTGIENSNYYVTLQDEQEFVLTIAEDIELHQVPFFNDLLQQVGSAGLPAPQPERTLDGMSSTIFKGKPTWLFGRLPGEHVSNPTAQQCREIGRVLAQVHLATEKCRYQRANVYGSEWLNTAMASTGHRLTTTQQQKLTAAAEHYLQIERSPLELPRGIVHGDLFRDNALFQGEELTGVIDFYHACEDYLIQDVAIAINDWCMVDGELDSEKHQALLDGYNEVRQLIHTELEALPLFRRFAAMRFALTRLLADQTDNPERQPTPMLAMLD